MTKKGSRSQLKILFNQQHFSGAKIRLRGYAATVSLSTSKQFCFIFEPSKKRKLID